MNQAIKTAVRGAYDIQKLRIQMGNRVVMNFKSKLGQKPGMKEEDLEAQEQRVINDLRARYRKIMDGVKSFPRKASFKGDEVISTYTELCLLSQYVELEDSEAAHFRNLTHALKDEPIYTGFLEGVRGCGPAMSGVIVSEIDISKAKYASSLWAYAGLDVASDGRGRSRKKEHLVEREYPNKDGEIAQRVGITFNPFLKTKLYVLGTCFMKGNPVYKAIYDGYKNRLENHPAHKEKTKMHRHNMAMRYMIKRFLVDLYVAWRTIEGLPVHQEYSEGKLGIKHAA